MAGDKNVEQGDAGLGLEDEDRLPWLESADGFEEEGEGQACGYRDQDARCREQGRIGVGDDPARCIQQRRRSGKGMDQPFETLRLSGRAQQDGVAGQGRERYGLSAARIGGNSRQRREFVWEIARCR